MRPVGMDTNWMCRRDTWAACCSCRARNTHAGAWCVRTQLSRSSHLSFATASPQHATRSACLSLCIFPCIFACVDVCVQGTALLCDHAQLCACVAHLHHQSAQHREGHGACAWHARRRRAGRKQHRAALLPPVAPVFLAVLASRYLLKMLKMGGARARHRPLWQRRRQRDHDRR